MSIEMLERVNNHMHTFILMSESDVHKNTVS
jgi:hypothetical protein